MGFAAARPPGFESQHCHFFKLRGCGPMTARLYVSFPRCAAWASLFTSAGLRDPWTGQRGVSAWRVVAHPLLPAALRGCCCMVGAEWGLLAGSWPLLHVSFPVTFRTLPPAPLPPPSRRWCCVPPSSSSAACRPCTRWRLRERSPRATSKHVRAQALRPLCAGPWKLFYIFYYTKIKWQV